MEVQSIEPQPGASIAPPKAQKKKGRWWKRLLMLVFAAAIFFFFGWVPYFLVDRIVVKGFALPDKENAEYVKTSFTLPREDIDLIASDGVRISGWWIRAAVPNPRGTVVLVHGLNRSRIEMVKKVEPLHEWGFNCVLIDLRHHGVSGNHVTTFGLTEKFDVRAATDFALSKSPVPVVLWGVSLGGASVTLDAADDPRVAGLITDSSYDTLPNTVRHHLRLFRNFRWYLNLVPQWPLSDIVLFWIKQRGGFDPKDVDVLAAAAKMQGRPTLFVANRGDARIPFSIAEEMTRLAGPGSRMILTESKSHGGAWRDARAIYEPAVKKLLDEAAPETLATPLDPLASKVATPASVPPKPTSRP